MRQKVSREAARVLSRTALRSADPALLPRCRQQAPGFPAVMSGDLTPSALWMMYRGNQMLTLKPACGLELFYKLT